MYAKSRKNTFPNAYLCGTFNPCSSNTYRKKQTHKSIEIKTEATRYRINT